MDVKGKSCTYGVTLIRNAPHREGAIAFLAYMLDPEGGLKGLREMGQPPFVPYRVPTKEMKTQLPEELRGFVEVQKDLHKASTKTFLMVTHDFSDAFLLAEQAAVMNHVRLEKTGLTQLQKQGNSKAKGVTVLNHNPLFS